MFLNSHLLSEVEITCDRVAFITQGEIVYESSMDVLVKGETAVRIQAQPREVLESIPDQWQSIITGLRQWGTILHINSDTITLTVKEMEVIPQINRYLVDHHVDVYSIVPQKIRLEDLFMQIIEPGWVA